MFNKFNCRNLSSLKYKIWLLYLSKFAREIASDEKLETTPVGHKWRYKTERSHQTMNYDAGGGRSRNSSSGLERERKTTERRSETTEIAMYPEENIAKSLTYPTISLLLLLGFKIMHQLERFLYTYFASERPCFRGFRLFVSHFQRLWLVTVAATRCHDYLVKHALNHFLVPLPFVCALLLTATGNWNELTEDTTSTPIKWQLSITQFHFTNFTNDTDADIHLTRTDVIATFPNTGQLLISLFLIVARRG